MCEQKRRDDFTMPTKRELAQRVGNLCSNPNCRALTIGAKTGSKGTAGVGVAAHITAAAIGGPRYNSSLTSIQRKAYDNGIWLCQNCSRIIDVDVCKYSVSLLKSWKEQAEKFSNSNIGKKLYDENSFRKEVLKSTVEHISDRNISSTSELANEALKINDSELSNLDSRFNVKTNIIDGKVSSLIEPKLNDIELTISAADKNDDTLYNYFMALKEEGKDFSIDTSKIQVSGSPLFEHIFSEYGGTIEVGSQKQKIKCELYATNSEETLHLGRCSAYMYGGSKKTIIEGVALNNFFSFSTVISNIKESTISIKTSSWVGKNLNKIPYFSKLIKASKILSKSGELKVVYEHPVNDDFIIVNTKLNDKFNTFIKQVISLVQFVHKARIVNNYFKTELTYEYFNASEEELKALDEICDLIAGTIIINADQIESNPKFKVELKQGFCSTETPIGFSNSCLQSEIQGNLKKLFNQNIPEYFIRHQFNNVRVVTDNELVENTLVELEILFNESSQYVKSIV